MTKKKPKFGALPTMNMPQKSHQSKPVTPRQPRVIVQEVGQGLECSRRFYKLFEELCKIVQSLKTLSDWHLEFLEDRLVLKKHKESLTLPELELVIDDSLGFTVKIFGCFE